jgi:hypothetical protein
LPLVDKTTAIIESGIGKNNAAYCRIQRQESAGLKQS